MKTNAKYSFNLIAGLYVTLISLLTSVHANAQHRDLYFGFEATTSSRKYRVHSDLDNLNGKTLLQQGKTYAIIFGSSLATGKFSLGNFSSNSKDSKPMNSSSTELALNINLLQLFSKQDRVIEPYLVSSIETTKIKSVGTFMPETTDPKKPGDPNGCSCQCPGTSGTDSGVSDPNLTITADPKPKNPVPYSGNFGTTRFNVGAGINVHLSKGMFFVNIFAEMKYGVAAGTTSSTQALLNTYALNQVVYNTGAAIGISKNRSQGRLRRNRFR